jgi:hypothetical protein
MSYHKFCQTHPTYEVSRAPRSTCKACWRAWRLRQTLSRAMESMARSIERLYSPDSVYVAANWTGGRGHVKGVRLEVLPRLKP